MPDLKGLATTMARDKSYSREPPGAEGIHGFVCPRANAYGGREGIIPPAVAVVRGLVPKGLHEIRPDAVAVTANAARDSGAKEADEYMKYYGRGAEEQKQAEAAAKAAKAVKAAEAPPAEPVAPAAPAPRKGRSRRPSPPSPPPPPPSAPPSAEGVARDPDDPGMFSRDPQTPDAGDTLDDFYDSLRGPTPGTGETDLPPRKGAVKVGVDFGEGPVGAPPPAGPRAYGINPEYPAQSGLAAVVSQLAEEKAELKRVAESLNYQVGALQAQLRDAQRQLEGAAARDQHYARVEQEMRESQARQGPAETVRVPLSATEERIKVGGKGWECNLVGALHMGRAGQSAVLTVSDPMYGSELLASAVPGDVVVVTSSARTYCTYAGHCVKIYGDAGSLDFIVAMWLGIRPEG